MPRREPTTQQLDRMLADSLSTIDWIRHRIPDLIRRDTERTGPDGYPASTGGAAGSTISTRNIGSSTETAGVRLAEHGPDQDPIHSYRTTAAYAIEALLGNALVARNAIDAAERSGESNRGRISTITECQNRWCGRDILGTERDRPRAGRCETCYRYWISHDHEDRRPDQQETA